MLQYLSGHFKKMKFDRHETESFLFYLHYRVTFLVLMVCCIAVTSNLFAGAPIVCTHSDHVSDKVMASYCWSHSTYSIGKAYNKTLGKDIPHPGVDASEDGADFIYRDYYQWVYLVLFVQGLCFYLPHGIWKCLEDGKMEQICENVINPPSVHVKEKVEETQSHEDKIYGGAIFMFERWGWYNKYALGYFFCEILAWFNVIAQTFFLDYFFQGEFIPLGKRAVAYFRAGHFFDNPLSWVFPRIAKCHFHKFSPSGQMDTVDVLCVLPVNALSEKIYLLIWFWYLLLTIMSFVGIVKTILTIVCPYVRGVRLSLSTINIHCPKSREIEKLASDVGCETCFGDWFVLTVLAKRMDILDYKLLLFHLNHEIVFTFVESKVTAAKIAKSGSSDV